MTPAKKNSASIAAADIGSGRIKVLAAEMLADKTLVLRGVGEAESAGVHEGKITDIDKSARAFEQALKEAEIMSECKIAALTVSLSGEHIRGREASGKTVINDGVVTPSEVSHVRRIAGANLPDPNAKVLAMLERHYDIDGHGGIFQPLGMTGRMLSGTMHLITASGNALANMEKCVVQAGGKIENNFVFSPLAAAEAVLTEDEKQLGVCVADIGAGTTDIVIYADGVVWQTAAFAIAGNDIRSDIAHMHHASLESSESAKCMIGVAEQSGEEFVSLSDASGSGENKVGRAVVRDTIGCRAEEIVGKVAEVIARHGRQLSAGVVLVGDTALMPGFVEAAGRQLGLPVRIGLPRYRGERHELVAKPRFAVAMGLLQGAASARRESMMSREEMPALEKITEFFRRLFDDGGGEQQKSA